MEEQQGLDNESLTSKTYLFQLSSQFYERLKDKGWWVARQVNQSESGRGKIQELTEKSKELNKARDTHRHRKLYLYLY